MWDVLLKLAVRLAMFAAAHPDEVHDAIDTAAGFAQQKAEAALAKKRQ